ncbi:dienelactone hydrolase family protein [Reichenbachiella carrageenanivorans]|uniref:Dienelactone hydrolase family protein n=1 Tax=Reichenbachiella carrageenanivorans TaxID=2979869 RepID=A0ABY6D400_9BACT|nr:dienelactone hydrolase family protein [Reichenbachiella carrageenanivorans]UXX80355.1 dienelactone hydrolase family protein [Reichenbachiella carrageenanivorans]
MIHSEKIVYQDPKSKATFEGVISWDDTIQEPKPGVLVVHTFRGRGDFEFNKAEEIAKLGYVGFAIDMYGEGKHTSIPEEADALMQPFLDDRALLLNNIALALDALKNHEQVDATKTGGIGFCFGGKCMLDLARSGADVGGVVSFHGIYDQPNVNHQGDIKAAVLVLHGWEDPMASPESTVALGHELTARNADWQILAFGHTGHAFTNPAAKFPEKGMYYQPSSNRRAWQAMKNFFEEVFSQE